ncbi:hypothetical protein C8R44DRAFT_896511 [Mycena epipterygia]|nr:hypothetical protein C8R44DRAFT_896511 [Mycena epipterygia]
MSNTKKPMLSFTTAIVRGLQDDIPTTIKALPIDTPSVLRNGVLEAHRKLSDYYYYNFDQSPYNTWAALLDPRISYDRLRADFEGDEDLLDHLKSAKDRLDYHFRLYYDHKMPHAHQTSRNPLHRSRRARRRKTSLPAIVLNYKLPREYFDFCDPVTLGVSRTGKEKECPYMSRARAFEHNRPASTGSRITATPPSSPPPHPPPPPAECWLEGRFVAALASILAGPLEATLPLRMVGLAVLGGGDVADEDVLASGTGRRRLTAQHPAITIVCREFHVGRGFCET